ncbi:hypothetical protein [Candidatus Poriferisocius sp.]|uniref:hypothetical protein n=1 Tax=Candidatus Poriferisocius sp. TaxID=3101276 RepID=UPI003B0199BB
MKALANMLLALLVAVVIPIASETAVSAVRSYQGDDYSYDYYNRTYMMTCDMESDKTKVKSKSDNNESGDGDDAAKDIDGNNGICASKNMGYTIVRHRTCEYRAWWRDQCDNWQATHSSGGGGGW